jgi:hypothetical protein
MGGGEKGGKEQEVLFRYLRIQRKREPEPLTFYDA